MVKLLIFLVGHLKTILWSQMNEFLLWKLKLNFTEYLKGSTLQTALDNRYSLGHGSLQGLR